MRIVKWFNPTEGYGLIDPDGGGADIFVHIPAVEKAGSTGVAGYQDQVRAGDDPDSQDGGREASHWLITVENRAFAP